VGGKCNVTVENLCLKYGLFGVSAGSTRGLTVRGCEIGWIGGNVQHYLGTDPNYPQGGRGTVTRFGNGVEVYGSCNGYSVTDCYIYQCYDAGVTHQKMATDVNSPTRMINVCYRGNLIEHCVYGIEYFLDTGDGDFKSIMDGIEMSDNILRFSGYGWGQQRHNTDTPAHIKGWSYTNPAKNYTVHDNIFDRSAYRMLHIVAKQPESCPEMYNNTYIQYHGNLLGQFGANEKAEPPILPFDEKAATEIATRFGDKNARVYPLPFQE
jgi:hypothetical protein